MKHSEILRKAATYVRSEMFVCHAIRRAADGAFWQAKVPNDVCADLLHFVSNSIGDSETVIGWLSKTHPDWYKENIISGKVDIFEYRIAWCHQMADIFESAEVNDE